MKISIVKEKEIVKVELREINDSNHNHCIGLQETSEQSQYAVFNEYSLKEANENAIYD